MTSLSVVIVCICVNIQKWESEKTTNNGLDDIIYRE